MNIKVIKKIKRGDKQAFRAIYDEYYERAMRTAYSMTRDEADASDAVQETFIRIYQNINTFDINRPFKPWFYRILTNEVRRILSKRKNNQNIEETVHENLRIDSKEAEYVEQQFIHQALSKVKDEHREVIVLKYLDGFSEKEVSELLSITVSAVKSRLYQARKKLQVILGGNDYE